MSLVKRAANAKDSRSMCRSLTQHTLLRINYFQVKSWLHFRFSFPRTIPPSIFQIISILSAGLVSIWFLVGVCVCAIYSRARSKMKTRNENWTLTTLNQLAWSQAKKINPPFPSNITDERKAFNEIVPFNFTLFDGIVRLFRCCCCLHLATLSRFFWN